VVRPAGFEPASRALPEPQAHGEPGS